MTCINIINASRTTRLDNGKYKINLYGMLLGHGAVFFFTNRAKFSFFQVEIFWEGGIIIDIS